MPPHQYVIARRIERAQHLLWADGELGLAEVALRVGFSNQSQFSLHFKRIVGVTPGSVSDFRKIHLRVRKIRQEICHQISSLPVCNHGTIGQIASL